MDELNRKQEGQEARTHALAMSLWLFSLCVGLAVGVGVGAAIDRIGAGVGIGTGIGVAVGLFFVRRVRVSSKGD
ncbi:hypothetical protein JW848_05165 [Candidatus Bipolaricaulota bacterium]|nr:hypothetical protein [Candidatus Bipolaricaulota bacterium]